MELRPLISNLLLKACLHLKFHEDAWDA